jgi:hypothetical protein
MYPSTAALGMSCGQLINTKHAISNLTSYLPTCRTAHLSTKASSGRSLTNPDHQLEQIGQHTGRCHATYMQLDRSVELSRKQIKTLHGHVTCFLISTSKRIMGRPRPRPRRLIAQCTSDQYKQRSTNRGKIWGRKRVDECVYVPGQQQPGCGSRSSSSSACLASLQGSPPARQVTSACTLPSAAARAVRQVGSCCFCWVPSPGTRRFCGWRGPGMRKRRRRGCNVIGRAGALGTTGGGASEKAGRRPGVGRAGAGLVGDGGEWKWGSRAMQCKLPRLLARSLPASASRTDRSATPRQPWHPGAFYSRPGGGIEAG